MLHDRDIKTTGYSALVPSALSTATGGLTTFNLLLAVETVIFAAWLLATSPALLTSTEINPAVAVLQSGKSLN